jgi:DNA polymerase III sliding clamp (beta) subunit (PCNA family)
VSGAEDPFAGTEPPGGTDYGEFSFRVKPHVLRVLAAAAGAAVPASGPPSMTCYRLRVSEGHLSLAATDLERTVIARTEAVYCQGTEANAYAEAFVPAKKLQAILKEAPEADLTVEVKKDKASVTAGTGSWVLSLPPSDEYPSLTALEQLSFGAYPREKFLAALRAVRHAVCRDAGRPPLTQVAVSQPLEDVAPEEDSWCVTASDGTRFARARLETFPEAMSIPALVLDDLMRLLAAGKSDDIGIAATEEFLAFRVGPVLLAVARRSTPFPDMDRLLLAPAQDNDQKLHVDRDELAAAVRRVRINADGDTSAIVLAVSENELTVVSRDKGHNSASEPVHVSGWQGGDRVLCVNHVFLAEMLAAHPERECVFRLGKDLGKRRSVLLLSGSGITQVLTQMAPALVGY